jgi:sedoheptulokinase
MNISTSAQVVYRCPTSSLCSSTKSDEHCSHCGVEFPYFSSTENIMVIASLNAGNVLSRFVKMLQSWLHDLTMAGLQESQIWNRLELLSQNQSSSADEALEIIPTLFGERHNPEQRASVNNVRAQNVTLGSVYVSLCSSLVKNLAEMTNLKVS